MDNKQQRPQDGSLRYSIGITFKIGQSVFETDILFPAPMTWLTTEDLFALHKMTISPGLFRDIYSQRFF